MQDHETETEQNHDEPTDRASDNGDHRGNGKIARLPRDIRDQVNTMLCDGVSYADIRQRFLDIGRSEFEDISEKNISNWKKAGHQRWLREQEWRDDMQQTRAEALEFSQSDDSKLEQVTLKTAAMRLYQLFKQFDAVDFSVSVENKPEAYTRLFSVLPRITREALRYEKYRDACTQARAAIQQLKDPNRKLTEKETRAIVRHVDSILGLQSMDHTQSEINGDRRSSDQDAITKVESMNANENSNDEPIPNERERVPSPGGEGQGEGELQSN